MIHRTYNADGQLTGSATDYQPLRLAEQLVDSMRQRCTARILAAAPEHRQRNAALGLLPEADVLTIKAAIAQERSLFAEYERLIAALLADGGLTAEQQCNAIESTYTTYMGGHPQP